MKAITTYEHPKAGTVKVVAPAVKMSETPATIDRPAPMVGEHTDEILAEFGYSPGRDRRAHRQGQRRRARHRDGLTDAGVSGRL